METLETITRPDELAKGFLAKATPTNPNKERIVFVLVHQDWFCERDITIQKEYRNFIPQKKEIGNMRSVRIQNVIQFNETVCRPERLQDIETMA